MGQCNTYRNRIFVGGLWPSLAQNLFTVGSQRVVIDFQI